MDGEKGESKLGGNNPIEINLESKPENKVKGPRS